MVRQPLILSMSWFSLVIVLSWTVATKDEAALVKVKNPDWDQADPNTEFLGPDGKPTDEAHAAKEPRANDDYQPYLTEAGT